VNLRAAPRDPEGGAPGHRRGQEGVHEGAREAQPSFGRPLLGRDGHGPLCRRNSSRRGLRQVGRPPSTQPGLLLLLRRVGMLLLLCHRPLLRLEHHAVVGRPCPHARALCASPLPLLAALPRTPLPICRPPSRPLRAAAARAARAASTQEAWSHATPSAMRYTVISDGGRLCLPAPRGRVVFPGLGGCRCARECNTFRERRRKETILPLISSLSPPASPYQCCHTLRCAQPTNLTPQCAAAPRPPPRCVPP
jgi:hypothetical protein